MKKERHKGDWILVEHKPRWPKFLEPHWRGSPVMEGGKKKGKSLSQASQLLE